MTNVAVAVGVLVALLVLVPIVSHNRFVSQRQQIASAWATIDAELQRRHLLVPRLVDTVRAAAAHERELVLHLAEAEARAFAVRDEPASSQDAEAQLRAALVRLTAVRESSPHLNSNANFLALQHQLAMIEDRIAAARRFYNTRVVAHNERIDAFPSNLVARNRGFVKATYFGTDD